MKSFIPLIVAFAASAVAAPTGIEKRDVSILHSSLRDVTAKITSLTQAVRSLDDYLRGDVAKVEAEIEIRGHEVTEALRKGANSMYVVETSPRSALSRLT
jgi:hypothetical protein